MTSIAPPVAARRCRVFGMITTTASAAYTSVALRSFFARTPARLIDEFILIDNDADFALPDDLPAGRITLVRPASPQGFATNANHCLGRARAAGADLFLLNNDLVFTTGWLDPLLAERRSLLSPITNGQQHDSAGGLTTRPAMDLAEYSGHEADLEAIAARHRAGDRGFQIVSTVPFYCIKIPREVYEIVGDFDERFGKGGAEDRDYGVRAWLAGVTQELALGSYVLHFQGKSTWRGAETPQQCHLRNEQFTRAFLGKWGRALTLAFLCDCWDAFQADPTLAPWLAHRQFTRVVRYLRSHPEVTPVVERLAAARFSAVSSA
jgi:GT2 family glycosyltransferase